jgi:hypothetical protein
VGAGFFNLDAGARGTLAQAEGFVHAEAGAHFLRTGQINGSVFGFTDVKAPIGAPLSWQAGVGARLTW